MSYSQLAQHQFTLLLPHTQRVSLLVPLTNHLVMLIFKDGTYSLWDYIENRQTNKGTLQKPITHYKELNEKEVLLIGSSGTYVFEFQRNLMRDGGKVRQTYSGFEFMQESRILVEIVENAMRAATQITLHHLQKPSQQPLTLQLPPCSPFFTKINQSDLFLLLIPESTRTILRQYTITNSSLQLLQAGNLNQPDFIIVHAHFHDDNLMLVGNNANRECELLFYHILLGAVMRRVRLFDSGAYMLHSVVGRVEEKILLVRVSESSRFLDLVDGDGRTIHQLSLEQTANNYEFQLGITRSTIFLLQNTNQKFIQKFKSQVPTLVKFTAYRIVSKRSLYAKLLKTVTTLTQNEIISVLHMLD